MIDLVIALAFGAVAYGSFRAGATYRTFTGAAQAARKKVSDWASS